MVNFLADMKGKSSHSWVDIRF